MLAHNPSVITDGLVGYWDAANLKSYPKSGTVWTDLSGNANTGTLISGPLYDSGNGGSIVFDGSDDLVTLPSSNDLTGDNLQNCTAGMWLKTSTESNPYPFSIKRSDIHSTLLSLVVNYVDVGDMGVLLRNNADSGHYHVLYNGGYNDGVWKYLVATVNDLDVNIYIDAVNRGNSSSGMQSVTGNTAYAAIGGFQSGSSHFDGNISIVKFYRKALSQAEITQNFNAHRSRFGV